MNSHGPPEYQHVLPETICLAAIGLFDLVATILFLGRDHAMELNPLMQAVLLAYGPWGFTLVKALLLGIPLAIAELVRPRRPEFVRSALRVAIICYIGLYALLWLRFNG